MSFQIVLRSREGTVAGKNVLSGAVCMRSSTLLYRTRVQTITNKIEVTRSDLVGCEVRGVSGRKSQVFLTKIQRPEIRASQLQRILNRSTESAGLSITVQLLMLQPIKILPTCPSIEQGSALESLAPASRPTTLLQELGFGVAESARYLLNCLAIYALAGPKIARRRRALLGVDCSVGRNHCGDLRLQRRCNSCRRHSQTSVL